MSTVTLIDDSNDKKYFISVPQIVLFLCRTPHDYTLWCVIKMIAGEHGECTLATPDLARLAMMSTGKVSDSRTYLLKVGLLQGRCFRDPGYPQPVWHLRTPDIWLKNIEWRQIFDSLKDRVELKSRLKALFEEADVYRFFNEAAFNQLDSLHNVNVESLHIMKPSQYEKGIPQNEGMPSQYEKGIPQNETKKNHKKNQKEKPKRKTNLPLTDKKPDLSRQMFSALADLCKYDLTIITEKERGMLNQAEKKMRDNGFTPADLTAFETWWYEHDWRGQKGQPPSMTDIRQTWGQFRSYQKGENHGPKPAGPSNIPGLREKGTDNPIKKRSNPTTGETYYVDIRTNERVPGPGE